jgi:hypothetical protein
MPLRNPWDTFSPDSFDQQFPSIEEDQNAYQIPEWLGGPKQRVPTEYPELAPEESKSLLGSTMSAIGYLGESIAKPGYAVRALASGDPAGAALNLIPFYDTIRENLAPGLPEAPKISGEQLLSDKWGVMEKPEGWFSSPGDFARKTAGLATELVDPLMLLGTGGLTAKGVAKMAGKEAVATDVLNAGRQFEAAFAGKGVTPTILGTSPAARVAEIAGGERALAGAYLPWSQKPIGGLTTNLGLSPETASKAYNAVFYANPLSVAARGLFSHIPKVGGKYTAEAQKMADLKFSEASRLTGAMEDIAPVLASKTDELFKTIQEATKNAAETGDTLSFQQLQDWGRSLIETPGGLPDANAVATSLRNRLGTATNIPELDSIGQEFHGVFDIMKRTEDAALDRIQALGGTVKDLNDAFVEHHFRGATRAVKGQAKEAALLGGAEAKFWMRRAAWAKDMPGGSKTINEIVMDPAAMGTQVLPDGTVEKLSKQLRIDVLKNALRNANIPFDERLGVLALQREYILSKYIEPNLKSGLDASLAAGKITPDEHAAQLASWARPVAGEGEAVSSRIDELVAGVNRLPKSVVETGLYDKPLIEDWANYMKSAVDMESNLRSMHNFMGDEKVVKVASEAGAAAADKLEANNFRPLADVWKDLRLNPAGLETFIKERHPKLAGVENAVDSMYVSPQGIDSLKAYQAVQSPRVQNHLSRSVDNLTNLFKGYLVTGPATHIRNFIGDYWNAIAEGNLNPVKAALNRAKVAKLLAGKGELPALIKEGEQLGAFTSGHAWDLTGKSSGSELPRGLTGGVAGAVKEGTFNPFSPDFKLIRGNAQIMHFTDTVGRAADWMTMREAGMSPSQALHYLNKTHYGHSGVMSSPFEANVARKMVPFWGWLRFNMPLQLRRLIERPGGITGQAVRMMGKGQVQSPGESYTPGFLREGMAVNVGGPPEATTFMRASGLPVEDLNKFMFSNGIPRVGRTIEKFAAGLHPLINLPIETMANKQLYSGRKISDLESTTKALGLPEMPAVDRLAHYSPFSRQIMDVMSLIDDRKTGWQKASNFLTGLKFGTYNVPKLEQIDMKKAVQEQLQENPLVRDVTNYYVPTERRAEPGAPAAQQRVKLLNAIQGMIKKSRDKEAKARLTGAT